MRGEGRAHHLIAIGREVIRKGYFEDCLNELSSIERIMAPRPGLEPGTYGLTVRCSTN